MRAMQSNTFFLFCVGGCDLWLSKRFEIIERFPALHVSSLYLAGRPD